MNNIVIDIKELSKVYSISEDLKVPALKTISAEIKKGEFVAIMGHSGSGKSTLLNILGCLDIPTAGNYILNGTNVNELSEDELATVRSKEIGFVFQSFNLLPRYNSLQNVALPLIYAGIHKNERLDRASKALEHVSLSDRAEHLPNQLSGGQRQRVAVARALVNNPAIILADEPTGNLDSKTSVDIMNLFVDLNKKGNTIIIVTHEDDIAKYAERVIWLRDGEIEKDVRK